MNRDKLADVSSDVLKLGNLSGICGIPECVPWYTVQGNEVLRSGDLGAILRYYRTFHRISQVQLSERINVDRSYISHMETQKRRVESIRDRIALADRLDIPYAALGISGVGQQDHIEMIANGESVVRLSRIAREEGRATDALRELDRLVRALEARAQRGKAMRGEMVLLAAARAEAGVALGDLLPEAHLSAAAHWTGSGARMIAYLEGEQRLSAHALSMHGNELRKAGDLGQAMETLQRAIEISPDPGGRATASLLLARAASESGNVAMLDQCVGKCWNALEQDPSISNFFVNPFSLREVELRGFLLTGRRREAERVASRATATTGAPSPTWEVMERVTMAQFFLATGETDAAAEALRDAIFDAQTLRLPHQVERAVRLAESAHLDDLVQIGKQAVIAIPSPFGAEDTETPAR
ncbi:XRE family transcriptional regulator [Streptomyces sp. NPDC059922]|uniref:helix-turn-helix domain-containing protein n=1 Tax=Streptomyces sp. NPDC059922 TaxID=3347005 RepID=UPI00365F42CD